ncbi:MAG: hypothetical protein JXM72_01185 [Deltaproteobacteria bacterium]|nr:hypothetical protein [Deltaproteobacteria bacterium]
MRSTYITIGMLFLFLALQPQAFAADTPGAPEAYFPETTAEFLPVHEGAHAEHTFAVRNTGTETLTILEVKTD